MTDETKEPGKTGAKERLEGFAQVVIGEIESLGGVITGDPLTSAEGDFNVQVGTLHQNSADALDRTGAPAASAGRPGEETQPEPAPPVAEELNPPPTQERKE